MTFLSNSDCHSPHPVRLGREFNRFEVKDITFKEIKKAINRTSGNKPVLNVGLPPEEGKYHESACPSCHKHYTLEQAKLRKWRCVCGKRIKKGVKDRINEKADFQRPIHPEHRPEYLHLIPLAEIIAKAIGHNTPFTKEVSNRWNELIKNLGSEIKVLIDVEIEKIEKISPPSIVKAIKAFREKKVIIIPGGGGEYGKIKLPEKQDEKLLEIQTISNQTTLLDY